MMPVIDGVTFVGKAPLYSEGSYSVYIGYIVQEEKKDIPHYLIVNDVTGVIEGSTARLFEARPMCQAFSKTLIDQDKELAKGIDIVEIGNDPNGNVDPAFEAKEAKKWSN